MAIYLDTNVFPVDGELDSLELAVLRSLADEIGHNMVIPAVVADELTARRLRLIETAFDQLTATHRQASRYSNVGTLQPFPVAGELAREYRAEIERRFDVVATPPGSGDEALRREAYRLRPARNGRGGRDTAIWLTIRDRHLASDAPGYFISRNVSDFAGTDSPPTLHADLRDELRAGTSDFFYFRSIDDFVAHVAIGLDPTFVDVAWLGSQDRAVAAVRSIADDPAFLRALPAPATLPEGQGDEAILFAASPVDAIPEQVRSSRAFTVASAEVSVCWTQWRLTFEYGRLRREGRASVQETARVDVRVSVQLWVRRNSSDGVDVAVSAIGKSWAVHD